MRNFYSATQCFWLLMIACALAGSSCHTTKYVPEGKHLLASNKIHFTSERSITRKGEILDQLEALTIQKPNTKFLGIPFKLGFYNLNGKHRYTDTGYTAPRSRFEEAPVLFDSSEARQTAINMQNYLFNAGYFYAVTSDTATFKDKKATAHYYINTGSNFVIRKVHLDVDDSLVAAIISKNLSNTKLKEGAEFSTELAQEERARIADDMLDQGYYRFNQDNILTIQLDTFNRDTIAEGLNLSERIVNSVALRKRALHPTIDVKIIVRKNGDTNAYDVYRYKDVDVYLNYKDRADLQDSTLKKQQIGRVNFFYNKRYVKERSILEQLYIAPTDTFSQERYDQTINRLNALGIFSFVRMVLVEDSTNQQNQLNAYLLLNPADKYDYSANFEIATGGQNIDVRSNVNFGSNLSLGIRDNNWLKTANQLSIQGLAGVELGYNSGIGDKFLDHFFTLTTNFGLNGSILFPRFVSPFFRGRFEKSNQPSTLLNAGATWIDRIAFFRAINLNANFTYRWSHRQVSKWEISPALLNVFLLPEVRDTFKKLLINNSFLANSYREVFIEGENLTYVYSNQELQGQKNYTYFRGSIEEAGLLVSSVDALSSKPLGINYAQYVKADFDVRRYLRGRSSLTIFRLMTGIGIPYDKNFTLPYIKQYFAGGPYSIRGWQVRQLGPGGFVDTAANNTNSLFVDRTGDFKLEANAEYRFDMLQLFSGAIKLNGAAFVDAGNIWLARKNVNYPGGELSSKALYKDLAVSTGAGVRLDIGGFFLLRVDGAFPIKKPNALSGDGWVIDEVAFGRKEWRRREWVWQFAIGYPF